MNNKKNQKMHLRACCGAYNECNNKKLLPLSQENYDIKALVTCSFSFPL